jgi:hypothetical protein
MFPSLARAPLEDVKVLGFNRGVNGPLQTRRETPAAFMRRPFERRKSVWGGVHVSFKAEFKSPVKL